MVNEPLQLDTRFPLPAVSPPFSVGECGARLISFTGRLPTDGDDGAHRINQGEYMSLFPRYPGD